MYNDVVVRSHNEMQNTFRLSDSECSFLAQALVLAADKYVGFAVDAVGIPGGERLQQQFLRQACEARKFAIAFGDSDGIEIPTSTNLRQAGHEAGKITNRQFADTIRERLADQKAVA